MNPAWDPKKPMVPVDKEGNLLHYPEPFYINRGGGWVEMQPFESELVIDAMRSGRSAKYVIVTDEGGKSYPMFIADLVKHVQTRDVIGGRLVGKWAPKKRGMNYGIGPA